MHETADYNAKNFLATNVLEEEQEIVNEYFISSLHSRTFRNTPIHF